MTSSLTSVLETRQMVDQLQIIHLQTDNTRASHDYLFNVRTSTWYEDDHRSRFNDMPISFVQGNMSSIPMELCATCKLFLQLHAVHLDRCISLYSVDADEIRRLGKRFKKLDVDGSGSLSVQEFMSIPELQQNPLVQRVIDIFDTDGNGEIDFKGRDEQ